jgi:hypothetical protein
MVTLMDFWRDMLCSLAHHEPSRFEGPAHLILSSDHDGPSSQLIIVTQPGVSAVAEVLRCSAPEEI